RSGPIWSDKRWEGGQLFPRTSSSDCEPPGIHRLVVFVVGGIREPDAWILVHHLKGVAQVHSDHRAGHDALRLRLHGAQMAGGQTPTAAPPTETEYHASWRFQGVAGVRPDVATNLS